MKETRVVSWNMAYMKPGKFRGRENRRRQWALLAALAPDLALLQECQPADLNVLAPQWMSGRYDINGVPRSSRVGGSSILAKKEFGLRSGPEVPAQHEHLWEAFRGYVTTGVVDLENYGLLTLASVHALAGSDTPSTVTDTDSAAARRPSRDRAGHNDLAALMLQEVQSDRFIFAGDWNVARLFDNTAPKTAPGNREFFQMRDSHGWRDAMRRFHSDEVRTYLSSGTAPFELDHAFLDDVLYESLTRADVIEGAPADELSDHAPLLYEFGSRPPQKTEEF
ncbi:endonuclease/exonuclease/phosphatase family protein [Nesterenkonia halotolerans]|uniref:Endonuclease/exonuclease/phosphatase family metal-dependent hydrolase n=1 Tax=Nesterenkonia halotolerans TaxID=225325 RepID=A0ABR9J554_9MICC|nr:endonuclease/exonuclease/phosphatase family protein [Nesterenkonia halotolerans]MBE1514115.1 endonuclease/exonuclease/phosphatase family metal-dependent hydrolase [Nesterenkonia halotolerans]